MSDPARGRSRCALLPAMLNVLAGALFLSPPAVAMDAVTFPQALARAFRGNPALAVAGLEYSASQEQVDAARGNFFPGLAFEHRFIRTDVPAEAFALKLNEAQLAQSDFLDVQNFNDPPPRNDFISTFTLEQPLFVPEVYLGHRMAKAESEAKRLELLRAKEETAFQVLTAYLDVLTAKSYLAVAEQELSDSREHQRIAEAAEKTGTGLSSDVLRTKVSVASAEGGKVTAENRLELARRGLALAMGETGAGPVDVSGPPPEFPDPGTLEERQAAASARADLQAGSVRVENAGNIVSLRKSEYLPTVGLFGAYQLDAEAGPLQIDNRSWRVGVGLKWNLFDGLRRESGVSKAAFDHRKAQEHHRGEKDRASFQVTGAYLGIREAQRRVEIARAAEASAEEGVRRIRARYENQLGRMIDLLDAQSALHQVRADAVRAENDLRQSRARLLYVSGTLLPWAEKETGQ
ncbi:MAG: efflux pump, family, outer membrane protein [Deltaproteobacteria bacterium]|nr:efflux pump, family, outer membrane protein [Deltaproteobacteria bacterium]